MLASLAASTIASALEGRLPVLLVFENDDPRRPVIVDIVIDHPDGVVSQDALPPVDRAAYLAPAPRRMGGVQLATVVGVKDGTVLVQLDGEPDSTLEARTAIALRNLKDPVAVLILEDGSLLVVGQIHRTVYVEPAGGEAADVRLRGARITIQADVELVLTCGASSVVLDARGKTVTSAEQIVSRARGANKLQGGSVHLN